MSYVDAASIHRKTVLYVGGLDEQVDERVLEGVFRPFGDLAQVVLPKESSTGKHRGFGFVEFSDPGDAQEAMDNCDDGQLFGRTLKVKLAQPHAIQSQAVWAAGNTGAHTDTTTAIKEEQEKQKNSTRMQTSVS